MNQSGMAISMTAGRTILLTMSEWGSDHRGILKAHWDTHHMTDAGSLICMIWMQRPYAYDAIGYWAK